MAENAELVKDKCPDCGSPMDFVCGPDGEGGGMHCWPCHDANGSGE